MRVKVKFPIMILGFIALLFGLWTGLIRLGWKLPLFNPSLSLFHGPLFVSGFLGTLISLERAIAIKRKWAYLTPLLTGLGALLIILGFPYFYGSLLITLGSAGLVVIFLFIFRIHFALWTITMALGAILWLAGNFLWLTGKILPDIVYWWIGFLIFTIAGERLELTRVLHLSKVSEVFFVISILIFIFGLLIFQIGGNGSAMIGMSIIFLSIFFLFKDIVRGTVKLSGLPRFNALSLLSGYILLSISGIFIILHTIMASTFTYDALLHAFFLGFVFSMVFAHAPIIFPSILNIPVKFTSLFYSHLIFLHLSLGLRIISDLIKWTPGQKWGGLLNALAILLFFVNTIFSVKKGGN